MTSNVLYVQSVHMCNPETCSQIHTIINVTIMKSHSRSVEALAMVYSVLERERTDYFLHVDEGADSAVCDGFYS